jgi:peptide/nickel transport system substrate-binding protein/microcin C transport system substrate-binding protein
MSRRADVDRARRGLATLLLGSPWAGALHAAPAAPNKAAAPADGNPEAAITGRWTHGFAAFGQPKYGPDFKHFDYVNPDAPRGGTVKLRNPDRRSSFDKFNPWTTRGSAPAGVMIWMVEGLCHMSQDEPKTMYGLLAEAILVADDFSSCSFRIHPKARFSNGDPVTPEDVVHSFKMIAGKGASPSYQTAVAGIERAVAVDARTVRFELREKTREQVFLAGTCPVFSRKWGEGKTFDQVITEQPILSGPYLIDVAEMPRRIEFKRNPDYWGWDLPVRRGHFNFDRVVYRMYTDDAVAREAFKAGEFELMKEYRSRSWVLQHTGPKWDDGRIVKADMPTAYGYYMQSFQLNLRRPTFQDIRVREALTYTYDFERVNRTKMFKRCNSMFNNSQFQATGLPSAGELALLEPFRAELPPRVFGPAYQAPRTDGSPDGLRKNLLKARDLLDQAGWKLDSAGKLRNSKGEAFVLEYMEVLRSDREDWRQVCEKLGIELKQRIVDFALFRRRLQQYDFEMVTIVEGRFTLPGASDLTTGYGSKAADEEGNSNYRGVKSKAVDALLDALAKANTMAELRDAARALDRVVMWNFWQIPDLYLGVENVSHWNRFGKPAKMADYFQADTLISGFDEHAPWPLWTWWIKSPENKKA